MNSAVNHQRRSTGHIVSPQPQIPTQPCKGIVYRSAEVTMYAITVSRTGNVGNPPQQNQVRQFPCYVCQRTTQKTRIHVIEGSGYLQTFFFCLACIGNGSAHRSLCRNEVTTASPTNPSTPPRTGQSYIRMPSPTVSYVGA